MRKKKNIGLVAHDGQKKELLEWVRYNALTLAQHSLTCTGTTGSLVAAMYKENFPQASPSITVLCSGPLGGDQQMGALIAEGKIDVLFFLIDPMTPQPHDVDVKALMRLCTVYNTVIACTRSTADFVISSPLFAQSYRPLRRKYTAYLERETTEGTAQK